MNVIERLGCERLKMGIVFQKFGEEAFMNIYLQRLDAELIT